jgi:hypothetical protein
MKTETLEALAALLNANRGGDGDVHFNALTELAERAYCDRSLDWSSENGYTVPDAEAPVVPVVPRELIELVVSLLEGYNNNSVYQNRALFSALDLYLVTNGLAEDTGNGGYSVPAEESPVVPDLRTETLEQLVALFEAFQGRDDDVFEARLANLNDYLRRHGWIDITSDDGYVVSAAKTPVLPYEVLKRIVYVLNAWANGTALTLHDGLVRLASYLVDTELIAYSLCAGYSVPETEAPEPRIIPFVPKD